MPWQAWGRGVVAGRREGGERRGWQGERGPTEIGTRMCAKQEAKLKREGSMPVFVISGPSGCGKTTVSDLVVGELGIRRSISATTRSQRPDEIDGKDYRFVSHEEFLEGVARGDYLEHAEYLGNLYGTPRGAIEQAIESDEPILLDIDVQGARQVKQLYPGVVLIFLMPPSEEVLLERLSSRGTDAPEEIKKRLERAREEMRRKDDYQYVVVNEELRGTVDQIKGIILEGSGK